MLTCENFCQTLQFWHSGENPQWLKTWPLMALGRGLVGKPWLLSRATTLGRPQGWQQGNSGAHVPTGSDSHGERGGCRVSSHLFCPRTPWGMWPFCARILAAHHHPPANTQPFAVMRLLADNQAPKTSLLHKHKKIRAIIRGVWRRRQFLINIWGRYVLLETSSPPISQGCSPLSSWWADRHRAACCPLWSAGFGGFQHEGCHGTAHCHCKF